MPTYEYVCRSCDSHLEVVQRFDEEALAECPTCGGALRKVFGSIGIAFKGSGFYKTDSRASSKATAGSSSKTADGATGNGSAASGGGETSGAPAKDGGKEGAKVGASDKAAKETKSSGGDGSTPAAKTA